MRKILTVIGAVVVVKLCVEFVGDIIDKTTERVVKEYLEKKHQSQAEVDNFFNS